MNFWILIVASVLSAKSCTRNAGDNGIRGKLVHRSCATIAVQVLDSSHYHLGQKTWQQSESKAPVNNVFTVANHCAFPEDVAIDAEFRFKVIDDEPSNKDCMVCMMWDNPPQKKQFIKVVSTKL